MCLVLLFQGSTSLTEEITASKYPEYKEYQLRVNRFLPRLTTDLAGDLDKAKVNVKKTEEKVQRKTVR